LLWAADWAETYACVFTILVRCCDCHHFRCCCVTPGPGLRFPLSKCEFGYEWLIAHTRWMGGTAARPQAIAQMSRAMFRFACRVSDSGFGRLSRRPTL
jgi:hypothetical protein